MGERVSAGKKTHQGDVGSERTDSPSTRAHKPGRRQKPEEPEPVIADLIPVTVDHFFPDLSNWFVGLPDPRHVERRTYPTEHLSSLGLFMFLFQSGSRRQLRHDRKGCCFRSNFLSLTGTDEEFIADPDTMNYLMERMPSEGLEALPVKTARALIRGKVLDRYRFDGTFLVCVDGVKVLKFNERHCPHCITQELTNGDTLYFHYALEAKLVSGTGLAFSLATVFIENPEGEFDKQDCERKAFDRMAAKLKQYFPRLKLCLLLDGLYADQGVLQICASNGWDFFVTFKEGSIPKLYAGIQSDLAKHPEWSTDNTTEDGIKQHLSWKCTVRYQGHMCHVLFCDEEEMADEGIKRRRFGWLTSFRPNSKNAAWLANKGARLRWKIENEGFNTQKNGGYELEHGYGVKEHAWKNYYFLLQIAHTIMQLITHGDLFRKLQAESITESEQRLVRHIEAGKSMLAFFQSVKNFVKRLLESFRNCLFSDKTRDPTYARSIQIRLDTS